VPIAYSIIPNGDNSVMTDNKVAPPAWIVSAEMLSVHSDLHIFSFSVQSHLQNTCAFILMNLLYALQSA
jgi:hypothetical protein